MQKVAIDTETTKHLQETALPKLDDRIEAVQKIMTSINKGHRLNQSDVAYACDDLITATEHLRDCLLPKESKVNTFADVEHFISEDIRNGGSLCEIIENTYGLHRTGK